MPKQTDLDKMRATIEKGVAKIINGATPQNLGAPNKWWTGHRASYTFPDTGETHNYWTGDRIHATCLVGALAVSGAQITQTLTPQLENLGDWNECKGDSAPWWRYIPDL